MVKFPPSVVERALSELPKDFLVTPADGGPPVRFGDGSLKLSFDQTPDIVDYMTNRKSRRGTAEILRGIAVSNALENVRLATGYCLPNDVPDAAGDVVGFQLLWTYSQEGGGQLDLLDRQRESDCGDGFGHGRRQRGVEKRKALDLLRRADQPSTLGKAQFGDRAALGRVRMPHLSRADGHRRRQRAGDVGRHPGDAQRRNPPRIW